MIRKTTFFGLSLILGLAACGKKVCADPEANNFNNESKRYDNSLCTYDDVEESLYLRLGGIEGIENLVSEFIANILTDEQINERFFPTINNQHRFTLFRYNLIDQICAGAEGPCQYKGKTMLDAHTGMDITEDEFDALVQDLVAAMDELEISEFDQNALLRILSPMESDIVGK